MKSRVYKLLIVLILLSISIKYRINYYLEYKKNGDYNFLLMSNKDDVYDRLLYLENFESKKEFNTLLNKLLSEMNNDLLTKEAAIRYINESNKKEYLSRLVEIKYKYNNINQDSTWVIITGSKINRINKIRNSFILFYLDETINKLDKLQ